VSGNTPPRLLKPIDATAGAAAPEQPPIDVSPTFFAHAARCAIGFIGVRKKEPVSQGSGTLIRFGHVKGILTCAHVLEGNLQDEEIGILLFPARSDALQMMRVRRSDLMGHTYFRGESWREDGPDLAFVRLPDDVMANIEGRASVVDGERQRAQILVGEPDRKAIASVVFGVVHELTGSTVPGERISTTPFRAFLNLGDIADVNEVHGMDLFRFRPRAGEGVVLPTSYKGTSGGGLWQMYFGAEGRPVQTRLSGVAFYETQVGDEVHIIGHGLHSIYQTLYQDIKTKWPDIGAPSVARA
jgi:hypothetical protein